MAEITEKIRDYVSSASIKHENLMDKLSEFLAVERGGKKLYQLALQQVRDGEVLRKFQQFYEQTIKHEEILSRIISDLGGSPDSTSVTARLAEKKAEALRETMQKTEGLTPRQVELNALENILLAETRDHADWELLGKIARQTTDARLSDILKPAVSEVESEGEDHVLFSKRKFAELSIVAMGE